MNLEEFAKVSVRKPPSEKLNAAESSVTRGRWGGVWLYHIHQLFNKIQ